jgi:GMP synthase (glutamine-hydrolysing)
MQQLLIIKTGTSFPSIVQRWGDFEDWFAEGLKPFKGHIKIVEAYQNETLTDHDMPDGVIITGSHAMITDHAPWSERIAAWIPGIIAKRIPLLGICYGHQLLAYAMGGEIDYHPQGREIGTTTVRRHMAARSDPLFQDMPEAFRVHVSHSQSVVKLPPDASLLASNDFEPHHAIRIGRSAWGLQFHPEFSVPVMRGYIDHMTENLISEGLNPERLRDALQETPISRRILHHFIRIVTSRYI